MTLAGFTARCPAYGGFEVVKKKKKNLQRSFRFFGIKYQPLYKKGHRIKTISI